MDSKKFNVISTNDSAVENEQLKAELAFLIADKRKLVKKVDDIDTKIIGIKEQLRKLSEKKRIDIGITNQDDED